MTISSQAQTESSMQPRTNISEDSLYSSLDELIAFRFHVKHRSLNSQQKVMEQFSGGHHSLRKGSGMIFSEVRQYQAGDDIRHIDWRVSARTQKVHTKVFTEEHEKPVIIVAEQTPALFFGSKVRLKAVQGLNIAAILGWTALQQGDLIGGLSFNQNHQTWLNPKRQKQTLLTWLQQAIQLQHGLNRPGTVQPHLWQQATQQLLKMVKPGSKLFLIGDMLNLSEASQQHLQSLRKHTEITAIHLYDPLEKELPKLGWLNLSSDWLGEHLLPINSLRKKTRQEYRDSYVNAWQAAEKTFRNLQIPLIQISTEDKPMEALLKYKIIQ
ncbi:DUF58 domain-containing protein [Thiomicrorhabdus sp.]|uniref:DUF58 domain-containing protein n=1 Tax=Thiomicrorhabdus sp. TaxID=2039724 RepID=UPI003564E0F4